MCPWTAIFRLAAILPYLTNPRQTPQKTQQGLAQPRDTTMAIFYFTKTNRHISDLQAQWSCSHLCELQGNLTQLSPWAQGS